METTRKQNYIQCDGCLALTANYLCDLGRKTWNDCLTGVMPLAPCSKIEDDEDYIIAHLLKM